MNAEVFAKGLEKSRLLTTLLGQNVENFAENVCPKVPYFVGEGKTDSSWICSSYRHKTRLHCAKRKAEVYRGWAMQHLKLFVRVYCMCVYY